MNKVQEPWKELATEKRFVDAIVAFVLAYRTVTLVQLRDAFAPFMEVAGDLAIEVRPNALAWAGLSADLFGAINEALKSGYIVWKPCSPLVYVIDGGALSLPIARRMPAGGYKNPHWLPVMLRPATASRRAA